MSAADDGLSRRRFLGLGAGAGLALGAGLAGPRLLREPARTGELLRSTAPLPRPFSVALPVPRVLEPVRRTAEADHHEIVQREAEVEILPGLGTRIWGYAGTFPGPTLVTRRGRTAVVRHRNELPVPTVVHLHGGDVPASEDGYPTDLVLPVGMGRSPRRAMHADPRAVVARGEREYAYPIDQRATTLWYHDHAMDFTAPAVWRGLAGFHLVTDGEEEALPLPRGERDLPLMICDRAFGRDGALRYPALDPTLLGRHGVRPEFVEGVLGDVLLVNGAPWPSHDVTATRHRLRLLNASNARRYDLELDPPPPGGPAFVQIGADGGLLERPRGCAHVPIAPAERYDVVVDFGRYPQGTEVVLRNRLGSGTTVPVMRFLVTGRERDRTRVPARLSEPPAIRVEETSVVRDVRFRRGHVAGREGWLVGGRPFSPDRADVRPRAGATERWRLRADLHHPVHLHLASFRVLERTFGARGRLDHGLKDTVDLWPGETADVLVRFGGHRGRSVFHCHNLEHEDMGMMATLELV